MKNKILPLLLLFVTVSGAMAQDSVSTSDDNRIRPIEVDQPMEFPREQVQDDLDALIQPVLPVGQVTVQSDVIKTRFDRHEAIKLSIPEATQDDVRKAWSKYLKKNADGKLKNDNGRVNVSEVTLADVSGGAFDAELQLESNPDEVFIWVAMERDSAMLTSSSDPSAFTEMQTVMRTRGVEMYKEIVQKEIEQEEKVLRKMNTEYDGLVRDNEKMHKKIDDFNGKIVTDNSALDINTRNIADSRTYVDNRKEDVRNASGDAEKAAKKELKKAERELKGYENNESKLNNRLLSYQQEIRENEQGIINNLDQQREKIISIRKQELLVDAYREKLSKVK